MIRILLVDDHTVFRQALAFLLQREPDITVVGQAGSLAEALPLLTELDLALVDLRLPDGDGVELIRALRVRHPRASALALTGVEDRFEHARAVEAGAVGVLHKGSPIEKIVPALRRAAAGEYVLPPREVLELIRLAGERRNADREALQMLARLTPREREVLEALASGLSDREISTRLSISSETVRTHMVNILAKLGVESRLAALVFAVRLGAVRIA
ncbi:MAG TPA: response regulator transcription factor [Thermomicrobiaceae bacterium]|nr:response regulator transcription factor [Thermomicrobiaceae bacterium]